MAGMGKGYVHASNYAAKLRKWDKLSPSQQEALLGLAPVYHQYVEGNNLVQGYSHEAIRKRVHLLNTYYNYIREKRYDNVFSAQGKFRPSILEEFMFILLKDYLRDVKAQNGIDDDRIAMGGQRAYTNLMFSGKDFSAFVNSPQMDINEKDQDFAIYRPVTIQIDEGDRRRANLPIVAIENKTYLDKTMLEGAMSTAEKIKAGNPYAMYVVVTEHYDVSLDVDPVYSRIDQIYVLRKNRSKEAHRDIDADVVIGLFEDIKRHIERPWSDVRKRMEDNGVLM